RFWAIGVGPGDPELLTLKAVRLMQQADVIYHAGPEPDRGRALETVRVLLRPDQPRRIVLRTGMSDVKPTEWRRYYRAGVDEIAADARAGRKVVFITEGDPTLYSTAAYVWQLLAELHPDIPIEVVPGVSSVTAAAARLQWPLAQRDEPLLIVPGSYHAAQLPAWLEAFPAICVMKPAKALPEIAATLQGRCEIAYVEEASTPQEWLTQDLGQAIGRQNYFSLVLLRSNKQQHHLRTQSASDGPIPMVPADGGLVTQDKPLAGPSPALRARKSLQKVHVVGIGPGDPALMTKQALQALRDADVIIGYEGYLRPLRVLGLKAEMIAHPIGAEIERARQALELAGAGKQVALVSSGDAGVYGMASLLIESAEAVPDVEVEIVPGITAAMAAAALLGAPLGHDFACISLSDLLTPWELIARRLDAAARSNFVVVLYNPLSQRRIWQLPGARSILLRHRSPGTPVGLVDKAHRPGMKVWTTTLGELTANGIGMETVLIVGSSQTRLINGRMVTPRGYLTGPSTTRELSPDDGACVTLPPTGDEIMAKSFAIIERELRPLSLPEWAFAVVRRMIHATADFDFARLLQFSHDFEPAIRLVLAAGALVVTDTEMVLTGIRTALSGGSKCTPACHLNDKETTILAASTGLTRSAAGIRIAARHNPAPLLVIGNAPTALDEALRLVEEEGWRPAAIVGMPVGFVGVEEAKGRLLRQTRVPYLTCAGRKGGSAVAAAAVNALAEQFPS
ncbi:hypothetical protein AYO44_10215, partial [Planctomycetaceae bacterium SCGC AG-212-F19]